MNDPFLDAAGQPRKLRGVAILSGSPRLAELAGRIGFETVWIEVEHGPASFSEIEAMCIAAEAGGAAPTVRLPDHNRHHVLRALECGARIVVVPMVNDAATARSIVEYGKFPPLGKRGYNTRSRGLGYGLAGVPQMFEAANANTHLIAQIETLEAAANIEAIVAVEGISGMLIGPGDLSASLGRPGQFANPELIEIVLSCMRKTQTAGKRTGLLAPAGPLQDAALAAGLDMLFCGGDYGDLVPAWSALLSRVKGEET